MFLHFSNIWLLVRLAKITFSEFICQSILLSYTLCFVLVQSRFQAILLQGLTSLNEMIGLVTPCIFERTLFCVYSCFENKQIWIVKGLIHIHLLCIHFRIYYQPHQRERERERWDNGLFITLVPKV